MNHIPNIELLNKTHTFPGPYTFKIIGKFEILEKIKTILNGKKVSQFHTRETPNKNHIAITVELIVANADAVVSTYHEILNVEGLVVVL